MLRGEDCLPLWGAGVNWGIGGGAGCGYLQSSSGNGPEIVDVHSITVVWSQGGWLPTVKWGCGNYCRTISRKLGKYTLILLFPQR